MTETNIVAFPRLSNLTPPKEEQEEPSIEFRMRCVEVDEIMEGVLPAVLRRLEVTDARLDESVPEDMKQIGMLAEGIRSYVCYKLGIPHKLHKLASTIFYINEQGKLDIDCDDIECDEITEA